MKEEEGKRREEGRGLEEGGRGSEREREKGGEGKGEGECTTKLSRRSTKFFKLNSGRVKDWHNWHCS
jgi:hypothetical protein